jgi:hypothetical protein
MFAIKIVSISGDYEMFSCNDFTVSLPTSGSTRPVGSDIPLDECPTIGICIYDGEDKRFEGRPIQNVAYIINDNGKTIDTIRP